ncbi:MULTISPECIES: hypothetical protein [unclassified Okeania]|nr:MULTISPECIES: hypothetical protein [unclassified Okeania]NES76583.1 hypothetical protein [Okeania sp. SIO1H4]NET20224.1 hypothetical protein [Okeania sp. SIO1H5]NET95346.1 hypothetical protein [Okeania sp. SIO1H2]
MAEKITVLAMSLESSGARDGLDNPIEGVSDWYRNNCGNPVGEAGQGTRIANTTGGILVSGVSPDTAVERIIAELAAQITTIRNVRLVASGATEPFVQTIGPSAGHGPLSRDEDHEISFAVSWLGNVAAATDIQVFNGSLDVVADGQIVGSKTVTITVPAIIPPGPYQHIPLIVELYDGSFRNSLGVAPGRRLLLSQDTPSLAPPYYMNNLTSSLKIRPGPNFNPNADYEVSFYNDPDYIGGQLVLKPGEYPELNLGPINFGNMISSVKFDQGVPPAPAVSPIPVVAELYSGVNYGGIRKLIIFEDVDNLHTYSEFNNLASSVKVFKGPNYRPGDKIRLYDLFNGTGDYIDLEPGEYPDLQQSHRFGNRTSSTKFIIGDGTGSEPASPGSMEYAHIPLIVELYQHLFTPSTPWMGAPGRRLLLSQDTPNLAPPYSMNNTVSSLKIRPGPNFDPNADYEVSFYREADYIGGQLVLTPGEYPDIHFGPIRFGDQISSVKFNQGVPPAPAMSPIPVVAELYDLINYGGRKRIIFEDVDHLGHYSGFDNRTSSVKVFKGPNYMPGDKIRLYDLFNGTGDYIDLEPGEYPNLQQSHTFSNRTSSTRFIIGDGTGSEPASPGSMEYAHIPLIVELYQHLFWRGNPGMRLLLSQDTPDLALYYMDNRTSSLKIRPGPNFDPNAHYEVSFYRDANYISSQLVLKPGEYPYIHIPMRFGESISSVKFNQGVPPAPAVSPIPVVAELYDLINYGGRKLIIFEDVNHLGQYSGYNDLTSSVKVFKGPNYSPGDKIRLYQDPDASGNYIDLEPGEYPNLQQSHSFSNMTSSTRFIKA